MKQIFYREVLATIHMEQSCVLDLEEMKHAIVNLTDLTNEDVALLTTEELISKVKELIYYQSYAFPIKNEIGQVGDIYIQDSYESGPY